MLGKLTKMKDPSLVTCLRALQQDRQSHTCTQGGWCRGAFQPSPLEKAGELSKPPPPSAEREASGMERLINKQPQICTD